MRRLLTIVLLCLALPATAQLRVVSLAPSLTEIMLDLGAGDLLVGVLDGGDRPDALAGLPSVGRYGQLQAESLLALKPDLVLLWPDSVGSAGREQLKKFPVPQLVVEPRNLEQLATAFAEIGERVGRAEQGRQMAERFESGLAELRQRHHRDVPLKVFYQVWDKPLYTLGGKQIVSDALAAYLARRGTKEIDDLLKGRLDRISREIGHARRDIEVLLESLSLFVRYQLMVTAPLPEADSAARAVGRERFEAFVTQVGRQIGSGKRSIGESADAEAGR